MAAPKIFLAIALAAWLPSLAFAMTPSQVYESVKDSVVVVKVYDRQGKQTGLASGVMLPSGDIVTNYHVVKAGMRYTVGRGKQATPATLKAGDPEIDLGLLTAPGLEANPARLGKAGELKVGEPVYAVGAPEGLELSLSEGIVSQLRGGPPPLIQTTVAISPGSSGGGLFNAEGELVGITTFYLEEGQNLNFALPVEWIAEAAKEKIQERPIIEVPIAPAPGAKPKAGWLDRALALGKAQDWHGLLASCRRWTQAEPDNDLPGTASGLLYEGWAVTRRPSQLTGRPCALSLMSPLPGIGSGLHTFARIATARPSKLIGSHCVLSLIPQPGTSSAGLTQSSAVTRRPSQLTGRGCAVSLMTPMPCTSAESSLSSQGIAERRWKQPRS